MAWRVLIEDGRKMGHTFSQPDLIIAATAIHHGLTVVTRDRSDYDKARVPVVCPWDAASRSVSHIAQDFKSLDRGPSGCQSALQFHGARRTHHDLRPTSLLLPGEQTTRRN
jgi:hypothetical protein